MFSSIEIATISKGRIIRVVVCFDLEPIGELLENAIILDWDYVRSRVEDLCHFFLFLPIG